MSCTCSTCGMGINMNCAKCGCMMEKEMEGKNMCMCPKGCGKVMSPMCCGKEMTCNSSVCYKCNQCDMTVKGMHCGKCGGMMKNEMAEMKGSKVSVTKCEKGCGQIKSPMCCNQDMKPMVK